MSSLKEIVSGYLTNLTTVLTNLKNRMDFINSFTSSSKVRAEILLEEAERFNSETFLNLRVLAFLRMKLFATLEEPEVSTVLQEGVINKVVVTSSSEFTVISKGDSNFFVKPLKKVRLISADFDGGEVLLTPSDGYCGFFCNFQEGKHTWFIFKNLKRSDIVFTHEFSVENANGRAWSEGDGLVHMSGASPRDNVERDWPVFLPREDFYLCSFITGLPFKTMVNSEEISVTPWKATFAKVRK